MVIDIINVLGVTLGKAEDHAPVGPDCHGPGHGKEGIRKEG